MQIATNEVQLTKGEYVAIQAWDFCRKRWPLFALVLVISFGFRPPSVPLLGGLVVYAALRLFYIWYFASSAENRIIYEPRWYELTDEFIKGFMSDGSHSELRYNHITKARRTHRHFILAISKTQEIIIPMRAFRTADDIGVFESLLRDKALL